MERFKKICLILIILPTLLLSKHLTPLEKGIQSIPKADYVLLCNRGWTIRKCDADIEKQYGFAYPIAGLTDYDMKVIYIKEDRVERALLHEVGHALDYELGFVSETEEFKALYNIESLRFIDKTAVNDRHEICNEHEYFASVYQNIIINRGQTLKNVPKTVEYILENVSSSTAE